MVYKTSTSELERFKNINKYRAEHQLNQPNLYRFDTPPDFSGGPAQRVFIVDPELITEAENRIKLLLLAVNLAILGVAGLAGYFLAGRTLKPIKEMIDEQNRFITDASHELRTPLTSLKSEIEVGLRDKGLSPTESKKLLESNLEEVNNLQLLSDSLIKLTQYQEQQNSNGLTFKEISLKKVLDEAIKKVNLAARKKQIKIDNKAKDQKLEGDFQSLTEMFVIFLDNAIKYSPKDAAITIYSKLTDGGVRVDIADKGIGIDKKDLPFLFDRFYRADKSRTKDNVPGYGLGLSIAKQVITKHQGSIKVTSEVGKGTVFSIELPLKH
jgi:two-component system sensor histidine kinase CiaH